MLRLKMPLLKIKVYPYRTQYSLTISHLHVITSQCSKSMKSLQPNTAIQLQWKLATESLNQSCLYLSASCLSILTTQPKDKTIRRANPPAAQLLTGGGGGGVMRLVPEELSTVSELPHVACQYLLAVADVTCWHASLCQAGGPTYVYVAERHGLDTDQLQSKLYLHTTEKK